MAYRLRLTLAILSLLFLLLSINAAPIPIIAEPLSWGSTPKTRGTLNILFSCVTALGLCIWTGVQLNVDPINDDKISDEPRLWIMARWIKKMKKKMRDYRARAIWATIALLVPDLVLAISLHQFLVASEYSKAMQKRLEKKRKKEKNQKDSSSKSLPSNSIQLKKAFFAVMGGFCVNIKTVDNKHEFRQYLTIGNNELGTDDMMTKISGHDISEINDKSKASGLTKVVACFQVGWILLQCLGRQLDGLHITLLEVSTAVHVVFSIFMYIFWWNKPVDISRSTAIEQRKVKQQLERAEIVLKHSAPVLASICGSVKEVPRETCRALRLAPTEIQRHFKKLLYEDIRISIMAKHRLQDIDKLKPSGVSEVTLESAAEAAYTYTYDSGESEVIREKIQKLFLKNAEHNPDEDNGFNLRQDLQQLLRETTTRSSHLAFSKAHEVCSKTLQKFSNSTESPTTSPQVAHTPSNTQHKSETPNDVSAAAVGISRIAAVVGISRIAARVGARRAIRTVALEAALNGTLAAQACATAFVDLASTRLRDGSTISVDRLIKDEIEPFRNIVSETVGSMVNDAQAGGEVKKNPVLYVHRKDAVGEAVERAVNVVKVASKAGVYFAAIKAIEKHKQNQKLSVQLRHACLEAERHLHVIREKPEPKDPGNMWKRVRILVQREFIHVPGLFSNQLDGEFNEDDTEGHTPETMGLNDKSSIATDFKGAEKIENVMSDISGPEAKPRTSILQNDTTEDPRECLKNRKGEKRPEVPITNEIGGTDVFNAAWIKKHRAIVIIFAGIAGAFYGCLHASKWNSLWFPTQSEKLLWRISCSVASAAIIPVVALASILFMKKGPAKNLATAACVLIWSGFLAARAYIVIESFLALRSLPYEAFLAVEWSESIPHI